MANPSLNCKKCQERLNYLPYHSYAEPPALKSKEEEFYCFDCFKSISRCKVCGKSSAQIDVNIHDKKTWYQPWKKIYFRGVEHIKPFDMCARYCDFFCSPKCLAQDDNQNYEANRRKKQAELARGWKHCEECVETYEELFAEKDKRETIIRDIANLVPPSEKICEFHKRYQEKDHYVHQIIYPKAQKWWDSLSYEEKLSEVKRLDIHWIATEKRKSTHEEVASRPEVPPFFISQKFEHEEPCISCGKIWKYAGEINCGKNSPANKISYCASCPSSSGNNQDNIKNESEEGDSSSITEIEIKKTQLQKIKEEQGENSEEMRKLESEIQKLVESQQKTNYTYTTESPVKNKVKTYTITGFSVLSLIGLSWLIIVKTKRKNPKIK